MRRENRRPPLLAEWLLRAVSPHDNAEFVVNDFREEFDARVAGAGTRSARRWYWSETLRSLAPLAARKLFRGAARHASSTSSRRGDSMLETLLGDVRYAARLYVRGPVASFAIVATMVLGVGSTTAVFTAMNAVLFRPLPFPNSERVIELQGTLRDGRRIDNLAYPDLVDFRAGVNELEALTVFSTNDQVLQHGADPKLVRTVQIDDYYAGVFGLRAAMGRLFDASDMVLRAPKVVVLSDAFWRSELGADRGIVGRTITLDDEAVLVVGVLQAGAYTYPATHADAVRPLIIQPNTPMVNRGAMWAAAAARLRPNASLEQTGRDLAAAATRIERDLPASNSGIGATFRTLHEAVVGPVAPMLELLALAVAAVLLIACVNVANLIFGRAQLRAREFGVRCALGGSPARLRQQVLTESLLLAALGGALGAALSPAFTRLLIAIYPDALPRADEIALDLRALAVAVALTLAAGVLAAIPAMHRASRLVLTNELRDGGRSGSSRAERRTGRVLIVSQVAASLALLFGAGLLLQTFRKLAQTSPGFDPRGAVTFRVFATPARYRTVADIARYYAAATDALRRIPGVREASSMSLLPFSSSRYFDIFIQAERGDLGPKNPASAVAVGAARFERALGLPVLAGRSFTDADDADAPPVVVINDAIAKRNYAGVNPIGKHIRWNAQDGWEIVGVVASSSLNQVWEEPMPILYFPATQVGRRTRHFIVRSDRPPGQIVAEARAALRAIDPTIALTDVATMDERIRTSIGPQRFRAVLITALGALALALSIVGIYGVVANAVTARTREIGIRMALGEARLGVARRVVVDALRVAAAGIAIGAGLALLGGTWLATFLIGVSPHDGGLLLLATILLCVLVFLSALGPARRAARVDPMSALRAE